MPFPLVEGLGRAITWRYPTFIHVYVVCNIIPYAPTKKNLVKERTPTRVPAAAGASALLWTGSVLLVDGLRRWDPCIPLYPPVYYIANRSCIVVPCCDARTPPTRLIQAIRHIWDGWGGDKIFPFPTSHPCSMPIHPDCIHGRSATRHLESLGRELEEPAACRTSRDRRQRRCAGCSSSGSFILHHFLAQRRPRAHLLR
ncbi:hypothetical protein B0H17DRAFT_1174847 [Mycena rosella]|uniref:Uncharacterized protein n=1 Tax=Mycena rosella TaxID=1033263 RepID=A0AAD7GWP0_MYCRO|nr:hypothetical protein B0H17DRAFT_1174847 [Mycena rosella]